MDKKAMNLSRYKRMSKIAEDPSWMAKYAQESDEKKDPYTLPTIKEFLRSLKSANAKVYKGDKTQGQLGGIVAKELVKYYNKALDIDLPAFTTISPSDEIEGVLADSLLNIPREDLSALQSSVHSSLIKLGDSTLSKLSAELNSTRLKDLIHFALARAYIAHYWIFLFQNPIVSVLLENEEKVSKLSSSLTMHQIISNAADEEVEEEGEGSIFETTLEDIEETLYEGDDWGEGAKKRKRSKKITDYSGHKIRISQLIKAFKLSRGKWARMMILQPADSIVRSRWLFTDAQVDYLERAYQGLKDFVADNPNNRFLKWNGQVIGDGNIFMLTTESNFNTTVTMAPPSFKVGFHKVDTFDPETGEVVEEYDSQSLRIPVKHWSKDTDGVLGTSLAEFTDIFDYYLHDKMTEPKQYQTEILKKSMADFKELHEFELHEVVNREIFANNYCVVRMADILLAPNTAEEISTGGDSQKMTFGFEYISNSPELIGICNKIWRKAHNLVLDLFNSRVTMEDYEFGLSTFGDELLNYMISDEEVSKYIRPGAEQDIRILAELLLRDMNISRKPTIASMGFTSLSRVFESNVKIRVPMAAFRFEDKAEECRREVENRIRVEVPIRDLEVGFVQTGNSIRDTSKYRPVFEKLYNDIYEKYSSYLKRKRKKGMENQLTKEAIPAIRHIVEYSIAGLYPDAEISLIAKSINEGRYVSTDIELGEEGGPEVKENLSYEPASVLERAEGRYHTSADPYVKAQGSMLRNILTGAYFEGQYKFQEGEFEKTQEEHSNVEQKKKTSYEVETANYNVRMLNERLEGRLFPTKPRKDILEAKTRKFFDKDGNVINAPKKAIAESFAMVETLRLWLVDIMGSDEDPTENVRALLNETNSGSTAMMGLYSEIGQTIGMRLGSSIEEDMLWRFPAGGKRRGATGGTDDLTKTDNERANQLNLLGLEPIPTDCSGITSFDLNKGPASHRRNLAEIDAREAAVREAIDSAAKGEGMNVEAQGKRAAEGEIIDYLTDLNTSMRFQTVRTKKTRYETVEEARRKPRVALSTNTFGGFIQQLFWSKSPYLKEYLNDEKKFRKWFIISTSASFGNNITRKVDRQLRKLWGPDGKYESKDEFMESVGAFADPMWAVTPLTKAFKEREVQKRKSGALADSQDTAEKHLMRAAYNLPSLDPGEVEIYMKHYFDKRAWQVRCGLIGADPQKVESHMVIRYIHDPDVHRIDNITNNPFKSLSVDKMRDLLRTVGADAEALNLYLGLVKEQADRARKAHLSSMSEFEDEDTLEGQVNVQMEYESRIEEASKYMFDGRREVSDWILDSIDDEAVKENHRELLAEAVKEVKLGLDMEIDGDPVKHMEIFGDIKMWSKVVKMLIKNLDVKYKFVKRYITEQLKFAKVQIGVRDELITDRNEKMDRIKEIAEYDEISEVSGETSEKIVKDFEEKKVLENEDEQPEVKKTVVRRRKKPADEEKVSEVIPEFEIISRALEMKVEALWKELSEQSSEQEHEEDREIDFEQEERLDLTDVEAASRNVERYISYLRSIRDKDLSKPMDQMTAQGLTRTIDSLSTRGVVSYFSDSNYGNVIKTLQEAFGITKVAGLRIRKKLSIGDMDLDKSDEKWAEDGDYYHFN